MRSHAGGFSGSAGRSSENITTDLDARFAAGAGAGGPAWKEGLQTRANNGLLCPIYRARSSAISRSLITVVVVGVVVGVVTRGRQQNVSCWLREQPIPVASPVSPVP